MAASIKRAALATCAVALLGACTEVTDHKGYVFDSSLINTVQPGVDNKDSVVKTLGHPSFDSEFDGATTWYYLSRDTRSLLFASPTTTDQKMLAIRFAANGDVASVQRTGMDSIRNVSLYHKRTPVLGAHHTFFSDLFGGVAPGGGARAPSADNPGGGSGH